MAALVQPVPIAGDGSDVLEREVELSEHGLLIDGLAAAGRSRAACAHDNIREGRSDVETLFEFDAVVAWLHDVWTASPKHGNGEGSERTMHVAIQLPDALLWTAGYVESILVEKCRSHKDSKDRDGDGNSSGSTSSPWVVAFVVLGDATFGSCCVDEVNAEHLKSIAAVVHFGHSCLTLPTRLPVFYAYGKYQQCDEDAVAAAIVAFGRQAVADFEVEREPSDDGHLAVCVLYDTALSHVMGTIRDKIRVQCGHETAIPHGVIVDTCADGDTTAAFSIANVVRGVWPAGCLGKEERRWTVLNDDVDESGKSCASHAFTLQGCVFDGVSPMSGDVKRMMTLHDNHASPQSQSDAENVQTFTHIKFLYVGLEGTVRVRNLYFCHPVAGDVVILSYVVAYVYCCVERRRGT